MCSQTRTRFTRFPLVRWMGNFQALTTRGGSDLSNWFQGILSLQPQMQSSFFLKPRFGDSFDVDLLSTKIVPGLSNPPPFASISLASCCQNRLVHPLAVPSHSSYSGIGSNCRRPLSPWIERRMLGTSSLTATALEESWEQRLRLKVNMLERYFLKEQ